MGKSARTEGGKISPSAAGNANVGRGAAASAAAVNRNSRRSRAMMHSSFRTFRTAAASRRPGSDEMLTRRGPDRRPSSTRWGRLLGMKRLAHVLMFAATGALVALVMQTSPVAQTSDAAALHARQVKRLLIKGAMVIPGPAVPAAGPMDILVEDGSI